MFSSFQVSLEINLTKSKKKNIKVLVVGSKDNHPHIVKIQINL